MAKIKLRIQSNLDLKLANNPMLKSMGNCIELDVPETETGKELFLCVTSQGVAIDIPNDEGYDILMLACPKSGGKLAIVSE